MTVGQAFGLFYEGADMVTVRTGSRLHFGLFHPAPEAAAPSGRRFGGVGLMIDEPALVVRAERAPSWSADGPLSGRAVAFAQHFASSDIPPHRLVIDAAPPKHAGLGSGTQLALAVAQSLSTSAGLNLSPAELARRVGRTARSALGTHGFASGGFLVEAGKRPCQDVSPLVLRHDFPEAWRIVVILPESAAGLHGGAERAAFAGLTAPPEVRDALCRIVLLGLVPALLEGDCDAFGEALHEFNARAGEAFAPAQGGRYAAAAAPWVAFLRDAGITGVGQSSWGPGVFAVVGADRAADVLALARCGRSPGPATVLVTTGRNRGATVES